MNTRRNILNMPLPQKHLTTALVQKYFNRCIKQKYLQKYCNHGITAEIF